MSKIVILKDDYIEKNCKDCTCKRGCDLYYTMLHIDKALTNIKITGNTDKCSFRNIRGVDMIEGDIT